VKFRRITIGLQKAKRAKDSAPLYHLCLGRTESLLTHFLDKEINSCAKGPKSEDLLEDWVKLLLYSQIN